MHVQCVGTWERGTRSEGERIILCYAPESHVRFESADKRISIIRRRDILYIKKNDSHILYLLRDTDMGFAPLKFIKVDGINA